VSLVLLHRSDGVWLHGLWPIMALVAVCSVPTSEPESSSLDVSHIEDHLKERGVPVYSIALGQTNSLNIIVGYPDKDLPVCSPLNQNSGEQESQAVADFHDLNMLSSFPISHLTLMNCPAISNLLPLIDLPLRELNLINCAGIRSLESIRRLRLVHLLLDRVPVTDLTPISDFPLESLVLDGTCVTNVSCLAGMKLKAIAFDPRTVTDGLEAIKGMASLHMINYYYKPSEFWDLYGAGSEPLDIEKTPVEQPELYKLK